MSLIQKIVRPKEKWNAVDAGIVLFMVTALCFTGFKYVWTQDFSGFLLSKEQQVHYVIYNASEKDFVVNQIKAGDVIKSRKSNAVLGTILSVDKHPSRIAASAGWASYYEVSVTIESSAKVTQQGASVKDMSLLVGSPVAVKGTFFVLDGTISSVELEAGR